MSRTVVDVVHKHDCASLRTSAWQYGYYNNLQEISRDVNSVQLTARKWWRHKGSGASLVASTTTAHVCLTSLHFSSRTPHLLVIPSMFLRNASLTWCALTLIRLEIGCIVSYCSFSAVDSSLRIRERKCKYAARLRWATSRPRCPLQLWIRDRNIR